MAAIPELAGVHSGKFGVEALSTNAPAIATGLPPGCIVEPASLEDIMYFLKAENNHDHEYFAS